MDFEELNGDSWRERSARIILPILVWRAQIGEPITYSELDDCIVTHGFSHHVMVVMYGKPAGLIGEILIQLGKKLNMSIPPINALIISKKNKLPGSGVDGYLREYTQKRKRKKVFSLDEKKAIVEEIHSDIYSFEYWDKVLSILNLSSFKPQNNFSIQRNKSESNININKNYSHEAESEEHLRLKNFVANNPQVIGLLDDSVEHYTEYEFPSLDRADIVFKVNDLWISVEIKSRISNDDDILRGIYQCIKYKALLRAQQKASGLPPTARSYLVVENDLSGNIRDLANILNVRVFTHRL